MAARIANLLRLPTKVVAVNKKTGKLTAKKAGKATIMVTTGSGTPGQTFMPDERADGAFLQSLYRATENYYRRDYGWNAVI